MKKNILIAVTIAALALVSSCQKVPSAKEKGVGYLSFSEFALELDESVVTKAYSPADGGYSITIVDAEDNVIVETTYKKVKDNGDRISVPAGEYTLIACSSADGVPYAEFENPVYGVSQDFTIEAGEETAIGELVCTLLQCKVTVAYSDEFMANVTGECTTSVEVTAGYPLDYKIEQNGSSYVYDQVPGYFAVEDGDEDVTMTVIFSGSVGGKNVKQTKGFTGIAPKQWRQVKFVQKVSEQGEATFDIVIDDLIPDASLNGAVEPEEDIIGEDPDAPKGDGGITLSLDYVNGCDPEITDLENILIVPVQTRDMQIRFRATVPNGVKKFTVDIDSDSDAFLRAVDAAQARKLDLINPLEENAIIFDVVPFPHGPELLGQTDLAFALDTAQDAIIIYPGRHTFLMNITDQTGCKKQIPVVMVVE